MRQLAAVDALGRGWANARANLELVGVTTLVSLAMVIIVIAAFLPWIAALGIDPAWFSSGRPDPDAVGDAIRSFFAGADLLVRVGGFLLSLLVATTLASLVYCWCQGGVLGVLVAGDAQAPAGGREAVLFRTWSRGLFLHEARRLTWRLFWFYSLFVLAWSVLGALTFLLFFGAGLLGMKDGFAAGCAMACGILLPLFFVSFALYAAMLYGQVELARPDGRVGAATRGGFALLGRRLGAAAAILGVVIVVSLGFGLGFSAVGLIGDLLLKGSLVAAAAFQAVLTIAQIVVNAIVALFGTAAFVAIARSEAANAEPA